MNFTDIKQKIIRRKTEIAYFLLGTAVSGIIFFSFSSKLENNQSSENQEKESFEVRNKAGFKYINPLVECEMEGASEIRKYIPFEKKAKSRIAEEVISKNPTVNVSVYFRNLNNGPWFGIKEREDFSPASMMKVVLMMAYYKLSEDNPDLLEKKVLFAGNKNSLGIIQNIKPKESILAGKSYSIEELIMRMIVYSDNDAMGLLIENISENDINRVYIDLGIEIPGVRSADDYMSVKDYASFFRMLYNASYLNRRNSEKALTFLTQVDFKDGLLKGIPGDVEVAHKFGERELKKDGKETKQLHDCGIVYYEKYPYLVCIMTRGHDFSELGGVIGETSRIIFEEIKSNYP